MCALDTMTFSQSSRNLVPLLQAFQLGETEKHSKRIRSCLGGILEDQCSKWTVAHTASCFKRRTTCIRWHPQHPYVTAYGTHGGEILLWDHTKPLEESPKIEGIGMGYGCITEMRFHPYTPHLLYTTAVDGRFSLQDFEGRHSEIILDTSEDKDTWWCSLDLSVDHGVLVVGSNRGTLMLQDLRDHSTIRQYERLHKGKIKYAEFCPARSWMFVTTSTDRTVKFWDVRMLRSSLTGPKVKLQSLSTAEHSGLVSSAFFDPIFGTRLLTTAQDGQIRTYGSHDLWQEPMTVISHSHRPYQHMTDIKATWHPLYSNLCVAGRYPNKGDLDQSRTVDLINVETGKVSGSFYSAYLSGIIQLNEFNSLGDTLASGMGYNALIWKAPEDVKLKKEKSSNVVVDIISRGMKRKNPPRNKEGKNSAKKKKMIQNEKKMLI